MVYERAGNDVELADLAVARVNRRSAVVAHKRRSANSVSSSSFMMASATCESCCCACPKENCHRSACLESALLLQNAEWRELCLDASA